MKEYPAQHGQPLSAEALSRKSPTPIKAVAVLFDHTLATNIRRHIMKSGPARYSPQMPVCLELS